MCHISAVTDFETGREFNRQHVSITPSDHNHAPPPVSLIPPSTCQSRQTSGVQVQHNDDHHVRFNACDLHNKVDIATFEKVRKPPEVIVLSSDDDEPPRSKRAKSESLSEYPTSEGLGYNVIDNPENFDQSIMFSLDGKSQNLNDSLEEFEMHTQFDYPLTNEVQSTARCTSDSHTSVNHPPLAFPGQPVYNFNQAQNQCQTYSSIYGNLNMASVGGDDNTKGDSRQADSSFMNTSSNSAVNLLMSSSWEGKTPTQKQIRDSVMNSILRTDPKPDSYDPFPPPNNHVTNTARMAREYFTGAPPPGFMAGAIARKAPPISSDDRTILTPSVERTPLKSLSLGHEDSRKTIRLQSDDRSIATGGRVYDSNSIHASNAQSMVSNRPQRHGISGGDVSSSRITHEIYNTMEGCFPQSTTGFMPNYGEQSSISRFADLKAFHQQQQQPSSTGGRVSVPLLSTRATADDSSERNKSNNDIFDDPWFRCAVVGPSVRAKV